MSRQQRNIAGPGLSGAAMNESVRGFGMLGSVAGGLVVLLLAIGITTGVGPGTTRGQSVLYVDDTASGLHDRSRMGVTSTAGFHSVDTGKLTTAPLFALDAAERVLHHDTVTVG